MSTPAERSAAVRLLSLAAWDVVGADLSDVEAREVRKALVRWYWSGPNRVEREVLRRFRIRQTRFGLGARSKLDGRYRARQRNRRRRR